MPKSRVRIPVFLVLALTVIAFGAIAAPKVKTFNLANATNVALNSDMVFKFRGGCGRST